jgi:hypothetical protein
MDLRNVEIITYCYKNQKEMLGSIITDHLFEIDYFLFSPEIQDIEAELPDIISKVPEDRLLLTARNRHNTLEQSYFKGLEKELCGALNMILDSISNYQCFNLVIPEQKSYYYKIIQGFKEFCESNSILYQFLDGLDKEDLRFNECYFILGDNDLSDFIGYKRLLGLELLEDVGVISLQEAPFKKYLEGGITTISLDMEGMVHILKERIEGRNSRDVDSRFIIIDRNSL